MIEKKYVTEIMRGFNVFHVYRLVPRGFCLLQLTQITTTDDSILVQLHIYIILVPIKSEGINSFNENV